MLPAIGELYHIEREARDQKQTFAERETLRLARAAPVLEKIKRWLDDKESKKLPKSPLGEAIKYCKNQWTALTRYASNGRLNIDNNPAERALRTVAVGRRNWLFAGSVSGGERAAVLYSVICTCKRLGVEPFEYLQDVLQRVQTQPGNQMWALTPRGWKEAREKVVPAM